MTLDRDTKPRLAKKARLRLDRISGKRVLLYPERGLELNAVGARIVELCNGERDVLAIVNAIAAETGAPAPSVERDVFLFLERLVERGLLAEGA